MNLPIATLPWSCLWRSPASGRPRGRVSRRAASPITVLSNSKGLPRALVSRQRPRPVLELPEAVTCGDYGNGEERKRRLGANYAARWRRMNEMLK